ncbi:hypothetical protein [Palleronia abyssalis]|uniref:Uncharacterized protein n=1 Tax=Palleronia abyssalis TaxID=1501240 RepID=A0A2R8BRQ5_9RHOB|nr:hypothetical protein [Palleronia abyssalis]SPJ22785.1 hypothetical protein PAA8504_00584 [Palleronia abyssalis]
MLTAISTKDEKITVLADHHIANRKLYRERIWKPARAMHEEIGSFAAWRRVLVEIEDYDGRLFFPDQRPFRHEEICEMFPDVGNRWMGLFLEAAPCGTAPKRYASPITYNRVRVIELYSRLHGAAENFAA